MFRVWEFCKRELGRTRLPENAGKVLLSHRYAAVIWLNGQPISGEDHRYPCCHQRYSRVWSHAPILLCPTCTPTRR